MNKNSIFNNYILVKEKVLEYGFIQDNNKYILEKDLIDGFNVKFIMDDTTFVIKVYDKETNEEYMPYNISDMQGDYISNIRNLVDEEVKAIVSNCFIDTNLKNKLLYFTYKKFNSTPEYPWEDMPEYFTLKVNNKWYLLYMEITNKQLGLDNEEKISVINIKCNPNKIEKLVDYKVFFPAYHMNKKYWITIVLNNNTNFKSIEKLIIDSYNLVCKKK